MTSSNSVIRLEAINKCYRIYDNPKDRFKQALRERLGPWLGKQNHPALFREHWALHDINLEINPGEAVGVLGRNGAGKSTLLQIIAGTLTPSSGEVSISGRITALLELGSGFNPEFTGRENVFHNAQILGLSRTEAENKFDEIASFADIGDFLDQPAKTYSSGMIMRLAFAVQTSIEPKILIVDEALSVGDMFFQAKCMTRINQLVSQGVTLLYVSHDIGSVRQLCSRAVLIEKGQLIANGLAAKVSDQYVKIQLEERNRVAQTRNAAPPSCPASEPVPAQPLSSADVGNDMAFGIGSFRERAENNRVGNGTAEIINVQMLRNGAHTVDFNFDELATIRVYVRFNTTLRNVNQGMTFRTVQGSDVVFMDTRLQNQMNREYLAGQTYCFEWSVRMPLLHTQYGLLVGLNHPPLNPGDDWVSIDLVPHAYEFKVAPRREGMIDGFVALPADLSITVLADSALTA
ncbi:ABC transporter ATP-binding protein [Uliginosibacterium sp. H3]|uniref:ABC transporter ATP-binding protein n=1 Tax=Uliginosibacterium silvisoli TaxID=3114758 RepID=A0ABU6K1Y0_9RHOO|nr:ABC transporter ATP-binding protein [Uliginosibacterium sp. H3]